MLHYRGIAQDAILDSLMRADEFIRRVDPGPVTTRVLDHWRAASPYWLIENAKDDAELADAMKSGRAGLFSLFCDIIKHHARNDAKAGGGEALSLYRDLSVWDGLNENQRLDIDAWLIDGIKLNERRRDPEFEAIMSESGKLFDEVRTHLILQHANRLHEFDLEPDQPLQARFNAAADVATKNWMGKKQSVKDILAPLVTTLEQEGPVAARDMLLAAAQKDGLADYLKKSLETALDIPKPATTALDAWSRFGAYGIVEENSYFLFSELPDLFEPLREKTDAVLKPFRERGEVIKSGIGCITAEPLNDLKYAAWGFSLRTTREAAQALADAFPGSKIIDHVRRRIEPAAPLHPGTSPSPSL